jgi:two-component system, NtrC family, nitrogen regulation sensor histidine kinase NtrY
MLLQKMKRLFEADWAGTSLRFKCSTTDDADTLNADPDLISQFLINLLRNATEAATHHTAAPEVSLHIKTNRRSQLIFDITDNGAGIAAEKLQKIFLPFYTTKAHGTGVGLSLSRQIAIAYGGSLAVENSARGKTCMRLILP